MNIEFANKMIALIGQQTVCKDTHIFAVLRKHAFHVEPNIESCLIEMVQVQTQAKLEAIDIAVKYAQTTNKPLQIAICIPKL